MALQANFTNPKTGTTIANAYHLIYPPVMRRPTRQFSMKIEVYASKADADAGKEPEWIYFRNFGTTQFTPLWTAMLNLIEPALINLFFTGATRIPD